jgi:hypothetical protein
MRLKYFPKTYSFFLVVLGVVFILFLVIDFTYSKFFLINAKKIKTNINIKHKIFHHHLLPNSKEIQGGGLHPKFKLITNSLGFRDSKVREIDLKKKNRLVFIGDSFTFGVLLNYEYTVPGLADIYFRGKGIEVLNAGVSSYSPSIYYYKTKFFIEQGLKFSHLVVFMDISDIEDEAIVYVVDKQNKSIKTNPEYIKTNSKKKPIQKSNVNKNLKYTFKEFLELNFNITYTFLKYIDDNFNYIGKNFFKNKILHLSKKKKIEFIDEYVSKKYIRQRWTIDENVRKKYDLGIQKSIYYMGLLKNLLDENEVKLTIVVYPGVPQIYHNDLESIQVKIWEEFSRKNSNQFINLFPVFINSENQDLSVQDKILKNFIPYDIHWNKNGSKVAFENFIKNFNLDYKN